MNFRERTEVVQFSRYIISIQISVNGHRLYPSPLSHHFLLKQYIERYLPSSSFILIALFQFNSPSISRFLDLIRFPFRMINRLIYHSPCVSEKRRIFARIVPCINKITFNSLLANQRMESLIHRLNNRLQKKSVEIFNYIFLLFFFLRLINDHRENRKEIRITIERMNERDVDSMAFL